MITTLLKPKLFMLLLGCKPKGRHTEQHDIYFGIGNKLEDLNAQIDEFWPEANKKIHIDAWREVNYINNFQIEIKPNTIKKLVKKNKEDLKLYFLNLGGYKSNEFEEYHYKILTIANNQTEAIREAKKSTFFSSYRFDNAHSHIDDKYGIDVDDIYNVQDIIPTSLKSNYKITIKKINHSKVDKFQIGYLKLKSHVVSTKTK